MHGKTGAENEIMYRTYGTTPTNIVAFTSRSSSGYQPPDSEFVETDSVAAGGERMASSCDVSREK